MSTLRRSDDTGLTLYVILRNGSHEVVVQATGAVETYNASNWATYDHTATEQGAAGYYYATIDDDLSVGTYWIEWQYQTGGSPAVSDTVRASGSAYWDGANWFPDWAIKLLESASPVASSPEAKIAATVIDTNELQTDWANGGRLDLILDATVADTNELQTDWADGGRLDKLLDDVPNTTEFEARTIPAADYFVVTDYTIPANASIAAILDDTGTSGVLLSAKEDVYHADVFLTRDTTNSRDEYTVQWYKNGTPVTSGITVPTIQVVKRSDGSDLLASKSMTQVGSTKTYKYDSTTRLSAGEAAIVVVTATIDSASRTWRRPVGRDI